MDKKYQIFVSSTYEDLKEERDQAIKAILEMGHIPVGMEMFSAADEEQWQLIARQIESTDYYVILVGHRYGSETSEGVSFTEKEYDYARSLGIPCLGFIIKDDAKWPTNRMDKAASKKKKLTKFKNKVKSKLVQFWSSKDDLHSQISISLIKAMNTNPRIGWTRSDEAVGPDVTKELSRLSLENSKLRDENQQLLTFQKRKADEIRDAVQILNANTRSYNIRMTSSWDDAEKHTRTMLQLFLSVAPNLIHESSSLEIARNLALPIVGTGYYKNWPIGKNRISDLIADFVALELLETSKKKHPVSDENSYWSLTKIGKEVLNRSRRIQLEEGISTDDAAEQDS